MNKERLNMAVNDSTDAGRDPVAVAESNLEDAITDALQLVQAFKDLVSDDEPWPAWLHVLAPRIDEIRQASEAYLHLIHKKAV